MFSVRVILPRKTAYGAVDGNSYPFRFSDSDEDYILVTQYNSTRSDELKSAILGSTLFFKGYLIGKRAVAQIKLFHRRMELVRHLVDTRGKHTYLVIAQANRCLPILYGKPVRFFFC